jgi:hypothetical protein
VRLVRHPGTAPNDFPARAKETVENVHLPLIIEEELKKFQIAIMLGG